MLRRDVRVGGQWPSSRTPGSYESPPFRQIHYRLPGRPADVVDTLSHCCCKGQPGGCAGEAPFHEQLKSRMTMVSRMTLLLALGLTWSGLGCTPGQSLPVSVPPSPPPVQPPPVVVKQSHKAKRPPKAGIYVAWGEMREQNAEEKGVDPARKMDTYDEARQAYQQALKIDPKCLAAYSGLARIYMKLNHYDRALETYHQGLAKFPKEFSLWFDMGICHCRTKQWDQAVSSFKRALEMDPENLS